MSRKKIGLTLFALSALISGRLACPVSAFSAISIESTQDLQVSEVFVAWEGPGECEAVLPPGLFSGFKPGMTGDEAVRSVGRPTRLRRQGDEVFYEFKRTSGTVVLSHEKSQSVGTAWVWRLRGYPIEHSLNKLFPINLIHRIPVNNGSVDIIVLGMNQIPCWRVVLRHGEVKRLDWLS